MTIKFKINSIMMAVMAAIVLSAPDCRAALQAYFPFEKETQFNGCSGNKLCGKALQSRNSSLPSIVSDVPKTLAKHSCYSLKTGKGFVRVKNVTGLSLGSKCTINVWVKFNESGMDDKGIKGIIAQRSNFVKMDWALFYRSTHKCLYFWAGGEARYRFEVKLPTGLQAQRWYMLTIVKAPASLSFYVDAKKIKQFPFKVGISSNSSMIIGGIDFGGRYSFDGFIDDAAVWDNTLTQAQITELFSGSSPAQLIKEKIKRWNYAEPGAEAVLPEISVKPKSRKEIVIYGRKQHPCVNYTPQSVALAKENIRRYDWAKKYFSKELNNADRWLSKPASHWLKFLPKPGACYAYGFTGCPVCGSATGCWAYARCSWDKPGKVTCSKGHVLPDDAHPDKGEGYKGSDGKKYYFIDSWNAWVTEQWTLFAIPSLTLAYVITGEEKYAELASFLLDALASIYSESTSGSIDYPGYQIGRLARPNYQVARNLVKYVDAYDLLYNYKGMDKPSLKNGLSRRQNIEENMLLDGAFFCYNHTFTNSLHNGHADYMRGALAVGCLLKIPEFVNNAVYGPFGIMNMIENNSDRDGNYYECTLGYGIHARMLYLTFSEPLRHYRSRNFPNDINLYNNNKFVKFYEMPNLYFKLSGHVPNFGDNNPMIHKVTVSGTPYDPVDHLFAEMVYNGSTDPSIKQHFLKLVNYLAHDKKESRREQIRDKQYLLFNAGKLPQSPNKTVQAPEKIFSSWNLGQKGISLLRSGKGENSQGALLRYGPTLTHGDFDELGLLYYARGRQMTYEIGYNSPASIHTQIGWGSQTASHTLVCVNEKSQLDSSGSGGSLYLFGSTPSLQLAEAGAPLAYASEKVSQYRRTVALIGKDKDQVLVDFFRVKGGRMHDYIIGTYGKEQKVSGVELTSRPGSLAGEKINYADKVGKDGNIKGHLKPYWNPPPQNGYGFLGNIRKGLCRGKWSSLWDIGKTKFKVHMLAVPGDTAITARAPGLRPVNAKGSYAIWRRSDKNGLSSCFASVMEPYGAKDAQGCSRYSAADIYSSLLKADCEVKSVISHLGIVLLKGQAAGNAADFSFDTAEAGKFNVVLKYRKAPVYGKAMVMIDGKELCRISGLAEGLSDILEFNAGTINLSKGRHTLSIKMLTPDSGDSYMFGFAGMELRSAKYSDVSLSAKSVLASVERLPLEVQGVYELAPAVVKLNYRSGKVAYVISSSLKNQPLKFNTDFGQVRIDGAFAVLWGTKDRLETVSACAVRSLDVNGTKIEIPASVASAVINDISYAESQVGIKSVSGKVPAKGIVIFDNPAYSRTTNYSYKLKGNGELDLLNASICLGKGVVSAKPDDKTILSAVSHEYGRKLVNHYNNQSRKERERKINSTFFQGKEIVSGKARTIIKSAEMVYKKPMTIKVESNKDFKTGEQFKYMDIRKGDTCTMIAGFEMKISTTSSKVYKKKKVK